VSLRARLLVAAVLVALVAVGGIFAVARTARTSLIEQTDRDLRSAVPVATRLVAFGTEPPPSSPDADRLSDLYIGVVWADGSVDTYATPTTDPDTRPAVTVGEVEAASTVIGTTEPFEAAAVEGTTRFRTIALPLPGEGWLLVALSLEQVESTYRDMLVAGSFAIGAVVFVLALAGMWLWRLGLRPIRDVTRAADAVAGGALDTRVPQPPSRTEAGHLARAFNVMVDGRQSAEDRLRRFVEDASHELRTPLTSIRGFAELYRRGGLSEPGTLDDAMRRVSQESTRMTGLVDDLLLLARLDQGRPLDRNDVDLSALLADAVLDASAAHPDRPVHADVATGLHLTGDEARLRQAVGNLLANAFTHTPAGTEVVLRAHRADGVVVIEVRDDGPGMDADTATHVFERFYRADAARTRDRGGAGLGLSIVQSVVDAHGGRVALETTPGEGSCFRIVLPVTAPDSQESRSLP
jgi:two-component system OmpR family sensor kinase